MLRPSRLGRRPPRSENPNPGHPTPKTLVCYIAEGKTAMEGLWIVQFEGTSGGGGGAVVLVQGRVLGGDGAFVYTGTYQRDGAKIGARVLVRNYNPAMESALGIKGNYELTLQGTIQGEVIKGSASLVNQEGPGMVFKLTKVSPLTA